jgi:hypothetical protein
MEVGDPEDVARRRSLENHIKYFGLIQSHGSLNFAVILLDHFLFVLNFFTPTQPTQKNTEEEN